MTRKKLTTKDAVTTIIDEVQSDRPWSNASVKRTVKALRTIGVDGDDLVHVLDHLGICKYPSGEQWKSDIKRIW